jgi:hypothetical protein
MARLPIVALFVRSSSRHGVSLARMGNSSALMLRFGQSHTIG